ncbi:hypothetical protein ACPA9J_14150 [Pseudomonas aeruginosa]
MERLPHLTVPENQSCFMAAQGARQRAAPKPRRCGLKQPIHVGSRRQAPLSSPGAFRRPAQQRHGDRLGAGDVAGLTWLPDEASTSASTRRACRARCWTTMRLLSCRGRHDHGPGHPRSASPRATCPTAAFFFRNGLDP